MKIKYMKLLSVTAITLHVVNEYWWDALIPFPRNVVYCIFNFKWQRHMGIFVGEVAFDIVY